MYRFSDSSQKVVSQVRSIAREQIQTRSELVDKEGIFPQESINALAHKGFLGLTVPNKYGGMGQSFRVACAVLEEISQCCASTAMIYLMHLCGVACYKQAPKKATRQLREVASGRHLSTLAFSEKGSRSHFWAPVSQAIMSGKKFEINAEKSWVTSASHAQGYVVSTRSASALGEPNKSTLYLVLAKDPGLSVSGTWTGLGMRGNDSKPMKFDKVILGSSRLLSIDGAGFEMMMTVVLPMFQVGCAAISVGLAQAAVEATQKHLTSQRFQHLNRSLADFPVLRARLAKMKIETDRAKAHLVAVLDSLQNPSPVTELLLLEVKAAASEAVLRVTDLGMQTCGGAAFSKHMSLERIFRDARASVVMSPTTDQAYEFVGRSLCGMELF